MSLKQSALLLAAAVAGAGLVLATRHADEEMAPAASVPRAPLALPAAAPPATPACNDGQRLAEWQLLSAGAGGYREAGFAVLYHRQRGTVTVTEGAAFGRGLVLQRVLADGVQLRCGASELSLALPLANGTEPTMRAALPDPERSASK